MLLRVVGSLLVAVLLSGCSIKMAYNNLDRLVRWGVSDYVDLTREQKQVLNREIKRIHYWHRVNHLPQYAEFTMGLATSWSDGVTLSQMEAAFDQITAWMEEVEEQATPLIIDMMVSLSDDQVAALPEKLEKSNVDIQEPEEQEDLATMQAAWADEASEGLQQFVGRLTSEQKTYIARRSLEYRPERQLWAEYRRRFQEDLMALLYKRADRNEFARGYRALVESRESYYGAELAEIFKHNQRLNMDVAAHVLSDLTEKQSHRFVDELMELGQDFAELAAQAGKVEPT